MTEAKQCPIKAMGTTDPSISYQELINKGSIYWDENQNAWVVTSAALIQQIMSDPVFKARPAREPVPKAIQEHASAEIYSRLIRMNDLENQTQIKTLIRELLASVDHKRLAEIAVHFTQNFVQSDDFDVERLNTLAFLVPGQIIAYHLGFRGVHVDEYAHRVADFVKAISPLSDAAALAEAHQASEVLISRFEQDVQDHENSLFAEFTQRVNSADIENFDNAWIRANAIGFMSQTYDATAALILNALLYLSGMPQNDRAAYANVDQCQQLLTEIIRFYSPVQNTRRFASTDMAIGGVNIAAGDMCLLLLAAANFDPELNSEPQTFKADRTQPQYLTFGHGQHQCPGHDMALTMSSHILSTIMKNVDLNEIETQQVAFMDSFNARIPMLRKKQEVSQ